MASLAVVGTGISGLVAARVLSPHFDVTVFEADDRIGGHSHTVDVTWSGRTYAVDTGFIIFNERTYPGFSALLSELGVRSQPTEMSLSIASEQTGIEWCTASADRFFAQRRNLLRLGSYRLVASIVRFNRLARRHAGAPGETLADFLRRHRFSDRFAQSYILPMCAALWSTPVGRAGEFPFRALAAFMDNHGLLSLSQHLTWRTVVGGSRTYVAALAASFRDRIHTRTAVREIRRSARGVEIRTDACTAHFDRVVIAVHSDQALSMLSDPSPSEREVLGAIRYLDNDVVLHTDSSVLPKARKAWASWNVHVPAGPRDRVCVTYNMNFLQRLDAPVQFCVTLNRTARIRPSTVIERMTYQHPQYDVAAAEARQRRSEVSGVNRTHYCGAYWGYGFHEDGLQSARAVGRELGVAP